MQSAAPSQELVFNKNHVNYYMVIRFAHTSDIHLGFQRDPALQDVEMETFRSMMDSFIERR